MAKRNRNKPNPAPEPTPEESLKLKRHRHALISASALSFSTLLTCAANQIVTEMIRTGRGYGHHKFNMPGLSDAANRPCLVTVTVGDEAVQTMQSVLIQMLEDEDDNPGSDAAVPANS